MSTVDAVSMLAITSVPTTMTEKELAAAKLMPISTRRNAPKGQPQLPPEQRSRHLLMPEISLRDVPSRFELVLSEKIYEIARAQLAQLWTDEPGITEAPAALFTEDGILAYWAREAASQRLSTDTIHAWFVTSTIGSRIAKIEEDNKRAAMTKKYRDDGFAKIAAPVIPFNQQECAQLLDQLNKEAEQDSTIFKQMTARLRNRIAELSKQREMAFSDDLPE